MTNSKKGIELPVNAMIILVLAVIVLLAAIAIFTGVWNPGKKTTGDIGDFNSACARYAAVGCCQGASEPSACTQAPPAGGDSVSKQLTDAATRSGVAQARTTCCKN